MEALVENTATPPTRFYCHTCTIEIDNISSEYTCPLCSQGFIEELPAAERSGSSSGPPPLLHVGPAMHDYGNPQFSNEQAYRLAGEIFTNTFSPFFRNPNDGEGAGGSSGAGNGDHALYALEDIPIDGGSHPPGAPGAGGPVGLDGGEGAAGSSGAGSGAGGVTLFGGDPRPSMRFPGRRGSRRRGMQNINHVDHILREILISVSGGANGGGAGGPMFFMGNPGDYAWGREGIDTIVTQLLNQMDNTGPPPLEKERIAEIPTVTINAEQVDRKLQCSVCFEDFVIDEAVRKLPCLHVYHEPCIIPWLELHGTCPICRKSLTPEQSQGSPQQHAQDSADGTPPEESSEEQTGQHQQEQRHAQQTSSSQPQDGERQNVLTFRIRKPAREAN
uniref:RING-type E3 ubiquitin transferase n=1 Tax=Anopheles atroparvus TaxID=41427 RepID=A0AAG5CN27_ANOAO